MLDISNFDWAECSITENRIIHQTDSVSLKRTKRSTNNHRYEFELVTIDMPMSEGRSVMAQLSAAVDDILWFVHPRLSYSQGTEPVAGIDVSDVSLTLGGKQLDMTSTGSWQLKAGDYIQFANHTKIYQVAEDTSLASGVQNVKLTSGLITLPANNSQVTVNDVAFQLISNGVIETSMEASENQDMQITLVAVERL